MPEDWLREAKTDHPDLNVLVGYDGMVVKFGTSLCASEAEGEAEEAIVDFESRKVKAPRCNCEVCMKARLSLLNYQAYDCTDPLAEKFKKAIDSTCSKHKIFI